MNRESREPQSPHAWSETLQIVLRRGLDLRERGNLDEASECFARCLDLARTIPDRPLEARALACLGTIAMTQGRTDEARDRFDRALSIRTEAEDLLGQARSLNDLALCDLRLGRSDDALSRLRESLSRTAGGEPGRTRAETLEHLGRVHRDRGDRKEALRMFKDALEIRRELDDRDGIASNLNAIGMVHHLMAQPEEAFDHLRRAYELRRTLDDRRAIAVTANNLALVHYGQGQLEEAEALLAEALTGFRAAGDLSGVAHAHNNLGLVFNEQGRMDQARQHHAESLKIRGDLQDLSGQANSLNNLSHLSLELGRAGEALDFAERALALRQQAGMSGATAKPLYNLGCALLDLGDLARAGEAAEEVVRLGRESGSAESEGEGRLLRTEVQLATERIDEAAEEIAQALPLAERTRDPRLTAYSLRVQAEVLRRCGRRDEARDTLTRAERILRGKPPSGEQARIHRAQGVLAASAEAIQSAMERLQRAAREFDDLGNAADRARTLAILARVVHERSPREATRLWEEAETIAAGLEGRDRPLDLGDPPGRDAARREAETTEEPATIDPIRELIEPLAAVDSPAQAGSFLARLRARLHADAAGLVSGPIPARGGDAEARPLPDGRILWTPAGQDPEGSRALAAGGDDPENGRWIEPIEGTDGSCWIGVLRPRIPVEGRSLLALLALLVKRFRLGGIDPVGGDEPKLRAEAFEGLVGSTPSMLALFDAIERVAASDVSVLVLGESGTGKELVARAIHVRSTRASGPFVPINCPSIPRDLIEAELFGHEKGAFTGATTARPGKVEMADRGTLFLDEIGDMD
ncbi:MAG: tetratricopeptide repeat protein, partial [Candidatus Eisenbacteria bacterium]|nr:tetratricopeptide repeat protein [Candidatus Latescibacterota bacterium]MBD3301163.1 tetratricopeptide repeat protein [Candidatus Eisenbacteria bacterium]